LVRLITANASRAPRRLDPRQRVVVDTPPPRRARPPFRSAPLPLLRR